ncbi:hypothetical protein RE2895_60320 (plasmid) [Rhodococcus erythropolis]|uniref:RNA polymerase sigma factor n=1 Tax=Rhodococcus erythropolis TaxID=1833 RepID=UPI0018AFBAE7|nr:RNA polymerase sigma factor [Rhodococcus erythropolis]BBE49101.1 hypothetical protein RE2895_60320 [Rhodococcus erythropolis]
MNLVSGADSRPALPNGRGGQLRLGRYVVEIEKLASKLRTVALKRTGNEHDSADLVQRTLEKIVAQGESMQVRDNPVAYACEILNKEFLSDCRRAKRRREDLFEDDYLFVPEERTLSSPDERAANAREAIEGAFEQLTPSAKRVVVMLVDWDNGNFRRRPQAEVARILGIQESSVASTLRDAKRQFKKLLPSYLEDIL